MLQGTAPASFPRNLDPNVSLLATWLPGHAGCVFSTHEEREKERKKESKIRNQMQTSRSGRHRQRHPRIGVVSEADPLGLPSPPLQEHACMQDSILHLFERPVSAPSGSDALSRDEKEFGDKLARLIRHHGQPWHPRVAPRPPPKCRVTYLLPTYLRKSLLTSLASLGTPR